METGALKLWVITDGRAGNEAQALGLAEAIARLRPARITLRRVAPRAWTARLPARMWHALGAREGGWPFTAYNARQMKAFEAKQALWARHGMTDHEMLDKARENASKGNYENVEFRLGEIENLPVADNTVDVIISNCVINLSPNKARVFAEAFRVLRFFWID